MAYNELFEPKILGSEFANFYQIDAFCRIFGGVQRTYHRFILFQSLKMQSIMM